MAIIYPSNIEYLGNNPNFTRDSYNTKAEMDAAIVNNHIDEGHLSYCKEDGKTYKAVLTDNGLVWSDFIGEFKISLEATVNNTISGWVSDLNGKIDTLEKEFLSMDQGLDQQTRLDEIYNWYFAQTHVPEFQSYFLKTSSGNLRKGTTHTYKCIFSWSWANRSNITGISLDTTGIYKTKLFSELGLEAAQDNGSYEWEFSIPIPNSSTTIRSCFYPTTTLGSSSLTITPLEESRTITFSGLSTTWSDYYNLSSTVKITTTIRGANLSTSSVGEQIVNTNGSVLRTINSVSDDPIEVTEMTQMTVGQPITLSYSWVTVSGTVLVTKSYSPKPSFILVSSSENAWNKSVESINTTFSDGHQSFVTDGNITTPPRTFTAGSTMLILSPYNISEKKVQSKAAGSDTWTTITGFSEKGSISYLGTTYYYRMNPNIGAGTFQFKFS